MQLTKEMLHTPGVFTGRPVRKEIAWTCGDGELAATVWIRPQSYQDVVAEADRIRDPAERIASAVCDEHGEPVFTVADITGEADPQRGPLDGWLTVALLKAISEVWSGKTV